MNRNDEVADVEIVVVDGDVVVIEGDVVVLDGGLVVVCFGDKRDDAELDDVDDELGVLVGIGDAPRVATWTCLSKITFSMESTTTRVDSGRATTDVLLLLNIPVAVNM